MAKGKREKAESNQMTSKNITEAAITALGVALLDTLSEENSDNLEVFERYTHVLRSKIHTHTQDFPLKLIKGYQVLLEELNKNTSKPNLT